jgi:hypothetical protein
LLQLAYDICCNLVDFGLFQYLYSNHTYSAIYFLLQLAHDSSGNSIFYFYFDHCNPQLLIVANGCISFICNMSPILDNLFTVMFSNLLGWVVIFCTNMVLWIALRPCMLGDV